MAAYIKLNAINNLTKNVGAKNMQVLKIWM